MKGIGKENLYIVAPKRRADLRKKQFLNSSKLKDKNTKKHTSNPAKVANNKSADFSQSAIEEGNDSFRSSAPIDNSSDKFDNSI